MPFPLPTHWAAMKTAGPASSTMWEAASCPAQGNCCCIILPSGIHLKAELDRAGDVAQLVECMHEALG